MPSSTCRSLLAALLLLPACGDDGPPLGGTSAGSTGSTGGSATDVGTTGQPTTGGSTGGIMTTDVGTSTTGPDTTGEPGSTGEPGTGTGTTGEPGAVIVVEGLAHPESILWDKKDDVYLISNINGDPQAADDNGFIARVKPDGTVESKMWITGEGDVQLDAPKGMAIVGDVLYVADITVVRKFNRTNGAAIGTITIDGAMFLNDLSPAPSGEVYVSDTFTNSVHVIDAQNAVTLLLSDPGLGGPNGLLADSDGVYVTSFNDVRLFFLDRQMPQPLTVYQLPKGQLDGIARTPAGDWLVTSWEEQGVYSLTADLSADQLPLTGVQSPADLDYDSKRDRALIPLLELDRAEFHPYP